MHPSLSIGNPNSVGRDSAYWAFRTLFNLVKLKYGPYQANVVAFRAPIESGSIDLVATLDKQPTANLTQAYYDNAGSAVAAFWNLTDQVINVWYDTAPDYPAWWLEAVGFPNGPPPPPGPSER